VKKKRHITAQQNVTMVHLITNNFYITGEGEIEGDEIALKIFSNGNLHSNSRIKPQ